MDNVIVPLLRRVDDPLTAAALQAAVSRPCGEWAKGAAAVRLNLSPHITMPATYEVTVDQAEIRSAKLIFNGTELPAEDCRMENGKLIIRQTQQVTERTSTELALEFAPGTPGGEARIRMISER